MPIDGNQIHGLADDTIDAAWPGIRQAELERLLAHFPGHLPARILWQSPRPFSAAVKISTSQGPLFVKRHHPQLRTVADLRWEHAFMHHLRQAGIAVPAVLTTSNNDSALSVDGWTYEVHQIAAGNDTYAATPSWTPLTNLERAYAAGAMLAQLHRAADGFSTPRSPCALVSHATLLCAADPLGQLQSQLAQQPSLKRYLESEPDWQQQLAPLIKRQQRIHQQLNAQPPLGAHNDWHVSNLCWQQDTVSAVFDFGLSSHTFALYDLATAIERNCVSWMTLQQGRCYGYVDSARQLIAGYHSVIALSAEQRTLLAQLLPIIQFDFALSEVAYFFGIEGSRQKADVAWHTFLIGHTRWFDGAEGKKLLAAIAQP